MAAKNIGIWRCARMSAEGLFLNHKKKEFHFIPFSSGHPMLNYSEKVEQRKAMRRFWGTRN